MWEKERESVSLCMSLSQMYLIRVGACPQTQGQRQTEMETGQPRQPQPPGVPKTWDHTSVRSSKQEKEVGPRWGAQGQRVRVLENQRQRAPWYDSRAPGAQEPHSTRQRTPPRRLNGPVTYPGTNKHLYPGEGQKSPAGTMSHRGQGSGSPKHKPSHGHTLIQSTHSLSLTH